MMKIDDIHKYQQLGEETRAQLKERIFKEDKYDIGCELVAFSNSKGGDLVIGINDKTGNINPLSYVEVQETTNLLSNIASENVVPSILIDVENVDVKGGAVVVAHIKEGLNKPYRDNKGIVWVKNGADKRKVFDNAELAEMMTECGNFAPDESAVADATIDDLDESTIKEFLRNKFSSVLERKAMIGDKLRESSVNDVCNAIYLLPYTGAGSGIQRAMASGLDVQFVNNESAHEFVIVIHRKGNHQIDESDVQSNYQMEESNHQSNHEQRKSNHQKLTKKQEDICNFCSVPRTSQEIMDRLGISNQSKNRQKYIGELLEMGVIEMTIPNNPKDKNQKYRKVKH